MKNKFKVTLNFQTYFIWLFVLIIGCRNIDLYQSRSYYGGINNELHFHCDGSYEYAIRTDGGYTYEYDHGDWEQNGKKVFLHGRTSNSSQLPMKVRTYEGDVETSILVNILPDNQSFEYLLGPQNFVNVDLLLKDRKIRLDNKSNYIKLGKADSIGVFRCYPKGEIPLVNVVNDTLSNEINFHNYSNSNGLISIDLDCNIYYFARIATTLDDTIRIINNNKLKLGKSILKRAK